MQVRFSPPCLLRPWVFACIRGHSTRQTLLLVCFLVTLTPAVFCIEGLQRPSQPPCWSLSFLCPPVSRCSSVTFVLETIGLLELFSLSEQAKEIYHIFLNHLLWSKKMYSQPSVDRSTSPESEYLKTTVKNLYLYWMYRHSSSHHSKCYCKWHLHYSMCCKSSRTHVKYMVS